jgi:hypothetical protein
MYKNLLQKKNLYFPSFIVIVVARRDTKFIESILRQKMRSFIIERA